MNLRSNYAQSLVELDSLTRVDINNPISIKEIKIKALMEVVEHFKLKEIKYYDNSQPDTQYYYDSNSKYIWYIFISANPLEMPGFKKINHSPNTTENGNTLLVGDKSINDVYYDEYVKIMIFNGYNSKDMVTKKQFNIQYNNLEYSDNIDIASGFNKTNKDFDYESFVPQLEMPNLNAEMPKCCLKQFMVMDSKTNNNNCLYCKCVFKTEITYNCPFCNNKQGSISVNGDGVYCINCNEDMDYGRSFKITKKVITIKKGYNASFDEAVNKQLENLNVEDKYDNVLNPPGYKPL